MKDTELSGLQGGVCASWSPGDAMGVESSGLVAKAYVRPPSKKTMQAIQGSESNCHCTFPSEKCVSGLQVRFSIVFLMLLTFETLTFVFLL